MANRNFGLENQRVGKGDKERSSKWRNKYDGIRWPHFVVGAVVRGNKLRKVYK